MKTLKDILTRYTAFLWAILKPLGAWGVLAAAALDGAAVGLPVDLVVGGYVSQNHRQWLVYVLMAATGSALGSLVIYAIGYAGGEELLRKRLSPALGAAVAEMSISHFLLAIFLGRFLRFTVLAGLVLYFGPGAVGSIRIFFSHHFHWVVLIAAAAVTTWFILRKKMAKRRASRLLEHTDS